MALTCGACTYSWLWDLSLEEAVHRIANMGFKYFELMSTPPHCWPHRWSQADRTPFRKLYKSRGLLFLLVFGCLMETAAATLMLVLSWPRSQEDTGFTSSTSASWWC